MHPTFRIATRPRARRHAAALLSGLVLAGAMVHVAPVHDVVTGAPVSGARLVLPAAYVALAPLCDLADTVAGLALHAHYALMSGLLALGLAWPSHRHRIRGVPTVAAVGAVAWRLGRAIGVVSGTYALVVLAPRPVARLAVADPDAVVVDFHSHTRASHDGRRDFSADANRAWHAAAGFDVAYVTDHATFASAAAAAAGNPRRAGDGTVLLPGVEVRHDGQHLDVLGTDPSDAPAYAGGELRDGVFAAQAGRYAEPRVVLLTVPADLRRLAATPASAGSPPLDAIELSDGAPRGLEQGDRDRRALTALADRLQLAVLTGSDDHGWATNAVAWSVLRISGWRTMTPDALDRAIRRTIRTRRRGAVQVVERRAPDAPAGALATTLDDVPATLWAMCRALSWPERLAWLGWLWTPWLLRAAVGRRASRVRMRRIDAPSPTDLAA